MVWIIVTITMPYDGAVETQVGYWGYDIDEHGGPMKAAEDTASRSFWFDRGLVCVSG